jgi:hypothetical protein
MKTLFLALSDDELKLLQGLASVVLARNLGMGGRETQKELTGRELLEDKITVPLPSLSFKVAAMGGADVACDVACGMACGRH